MYEISGKIVLQGQKKRTTPVKGLSATHFTIDATGVPL